MIENLSSLEKVILQNQVGVVTIKPKVIFEIIEKSFTIIPKFTLPIPSSGIGSVTTLEASLICSLLNLRDPKEIFEFGTFLGYTTSILLDNSSRSSKVYSIDLPKAKGRQEKSSEQINWELIHSNDEYNDAYLSSLALEKGEKYLRPIGQERLVLIKKNSLEFEPSHYGLIKNTDFIFLDGGHTDEVVRSDTKNSLEMLSSNGILIWHDYGSKIHNKVTDVVDEYSKNKLVLQISNTMLALTATSFQIFTQNI